MTSGLPSPDARSLSGLGREAFTECGGAKFGPSEDSFCRIRRLRATAMGQEADEKWTAAVNLQPTLPKSDRLLEIQDLSRRQPFWRGGPEDDRRAPGAKHSRIAAPAHPRCPQCQRASAFERSALARRQAGCDAQLPGRGGTPR